MFRSAPLYAAAVVACGILTASPAAAQKGGRGAPPSGAEIAQQAKGKKLDDGNKLVAQFQGQPIVYTPAADNALSSLDELRGGRFLGVLDTKAVGDESGLPPGVYNIFVAEVDGTWRAFAEANGEIVKEAARVRLVRSEKGSRKPGFGEKGWYISDPLCCVDSDGGLTYSNTVAIAPAPASVVANKSTQLTPKVYDAAGRVISGATVTWTSSNPAVATVSSAGVVQGVTAGTVTVTATSGTRSGTATVSVTPATVAAIQLSTTRPSIVAGQYITITATLVDDQGKPITDRVPSWTSGSGVKLYPTAGGVRVLGVTPNSGNAVTATIGPVTSAVKGEAWVTVGDQCACTLVISPTGLGPLPVGLGYQFTAYAKAGDGTLLPLASAIKFMDPVTTLRLGTKTTSSDEYYARTTYEGIAPGTMSVAARIANQLSPWVNVVVTGPVARVDLAPSVATVEVRKTQQVSAITYDAAGTRVPQGTVAWASSDPAVFVVSAQGVVTGANQGAGTLSATSNGVVGYAAVTVMPASVATVTVSPGGTQTGANSSLALTATLTDASGNVLLDRPVRWTTNNSAVAAVDQLGIVTTGGTAGTAVITATSSDGKSGTATVTVTAPSTPPSTTTAVAVEVYW